MSSQTYFVQIVEPSTGKFRVLCLYDEISSEEVVTLYQTTFPEVTQTVGFVDDHGIYYPFSFLWRLPSQLVGGKILAVSRDASSPATLRPTDLSSSSSLVKRKEEQSQMIFQVLDLAGDHMVDEEEFVEVSRAAFDHLLASHPGLAFVLDGAALDSQTLAQKTARRCFQAVLEKDPTHHHHQLQHMDYEDFSAWYLSTTDFDPLRELFYTAMTWVLQKSLDVSSSPSSTASRLKRSKSRGRLDLRACYDDSKLSAFFTACRERLHLTKKSVVTLAKKVLNRKDSILLSHDEVVAWLSSLWQEEEDDGAADTIWKEDVFLMLLELLGLASSEFVEGSQARRWEVLRRPCPLLYLLSLLTVLAPREVLALRALGNDETVALHSDLLMIARVIFYFNPSLATASGCEAEDLAQAIYIKVAIDRDSSSNSGDREEEGYIAQLIGGVRLMLNMLSITKGVMVEWFNSLDSSSSMDLDRRMAAVSHGQGPPESPGPFDPPQAAAAAAAGALEDDQIASLFVAYRGAPLTLSEAREALLSLGGCSPKDLVSFLRALGNKNHLVKPLTLSRALLRLVGRHYVVSSVLQRGIVDFILDRLLTTLDPTQAGELSVERASIALQLFLVGQSRVKVITDLIASQVPLSNGRYRDRALHSVILLLFQVVFSLHPWETVDQYLPRAEEEATAYWLEVCFEGRADSAQEIGWSRKEFEKVLSHLLDHLERVSFQRKQTQPIMTGEEGRTNDEEESEDRLEAFSDSEDDEDDPRKVLLNDQIFPPSSVVLELRAAACLLGLENYRPEDLLDQLGGRCHAGRLGVPGWSKWLGQNLQRAQVLEQDLDMSLQLAHRLFSAFSSPSRQSGEHEGVDFSSLCPGLALLCAKAPLEDRLMVAFTVVDANSDGFISLDQLQQLLQSGLLVVTMCSQLAARKVTTLGVGLSELSRVAALEGFQAAGLAKDEELTLDAFVDLADDFLKLASVI
eukprot:gene6627-7320_t